MGIIRKIWSTNQPEISAFEEAWLMAFIEEAYDPRYFDISKEPGGDGRLTQKLALNRTYRFTAGLKAVFLPRFLRDGSHDYALKPSKVYTFIESGSDGSTQALFEQTAWRKAFNPVKSFEFLFCLASLILARISLCFLNEKEKNDGFFHFVEIDTVNQSWFLIIVRTILGLLIRLPLRLAATAFSYGYEIVRMFTSPWNHLVLPILQFSRRIFAQPGGVIPNQFVGIFGFHNPFVRYFGGISFLVVMFAVLTIASFITASVLTGGIFPGVVFLGWLSATIVSAIPIIAVSLPWIFGTTIAVKIGMIVVSFILLPGLVHRFIEGFIPALKDLVNCWGGIYSPKPGFDKKEDMMARLTCINSFPNENELEEDDLGDINHQELLHHSRYHIPTTSPLYKGYDFEKPFQMFNVDPFAAQRIPNEEEAKNSGESLRLLQQEQQENKVTEINDDDGLLNSTVNSSKTLKVEGRLVSDDVQNGVLLTGSDEETAYEQQQQQQEESQDLTMITTTSTIATIASGAGELTPPPHIEQYVDGVRVPNDLDNDPDDGDFVCSIFHKKKPPGLLTGNFRGTDLNPTKLAAVSSSYASMSTLVTYSNIFRTGSIASSSSSYSTSASSSSSSYSTSASSSSSSSSTYSASAVVKLSTPR